MKSKIRDLITELAAQMSKINNLFNIAKAMKTDSDVKTVPWSVVYAEMKLKATAYDEIRTLISNSRGQMDRLCLYKNQVKRLANKVSSEEEEYKAHRVTSIRIRDSELDENTTRSYILLAREVCLASCELILEHKELMLEFQQSSLRFRENCLINYEYHYSRAIESTKKAKEKEANKAKAAAAAKLELAAAPVEGSPKRASKRSHTSSNPKPDEVPEKKIKEN